MNVKKKFEKNIFTEVIEDKPPKNQTEKEENINNEINNNKEQNENKIDIIKGKSSEEIKNSQKNQKIVKKIKEISSQDFISIEELRNICWKGIPSEDPLIRAECWKILLGLYPLKKELKNSVIQRKINRRFNFSQSFFG